MVVNILYYIRQKKALVPTKYRIHTSFSLDMLHKDNKTLLRLRHITQTAIMFMFVRMVLLLPFPKVLRNSIVVVDFCILRAWEQNSLISKFATPLLITNCLHKPYSLRKTSDKRTNERWYVTQSGQILPPP